jgi:pantothenate kinase
MTGCADELAQRVRALVAAQPRVILGITGPPGSGKSTLAEAVAAEVDGAVYVPMDGFHLADVQLARLGRLDHKGAIDTFDADGFLALLERIRAERPGIVYAPAFDRQIEQPVAASIAVPPTARLVVAEGNYLLDDDPPWPSIRALLSEVWYLDTPGDERRRRLVARHVRFGKTPNRAETWVANVDDRNAERIERFRGKADLIVSGF